MKVKELTITSILLGIIIGIIMTAANVYLGLYAGMTVSASIPAAVIATGVFRGILRKNAIHQSNIVQTMASAGESLAAGVIFTLPALVIVGAWQGFKFWPTTLIAISGGLLGVIFMIPLRKALIQNEKELIYPEGVACATVLRAANSSDNKDGFITIIKGLIIGGVFKFFITGKKLILASVEGATKISSSTWFMGMDVSPALLSVGYIVKLEVAILVFIGGLIGFSVAIPLLGTPDGLSSLNPIDLAWTLWSTKVRYLGVGAMITGGMWSIVSVRKGIVSGIKGLKDAYDNKEGNIERTQQDMHLWAMLIVLLVCFCIMLGLYNQLIGSFGISALTTFLMIICSFLFVAVSSYIVGLVGSSNNPVSGMTISALLVTASLFLVLGLKGENAILSTLGVAAVVCCAACTAGDCSQDLKTGSIIGATPKYQQFAQMIGVIIPAFVIAPVLTLLHNAYTIGEGLKAPQATLFASITRALFGNGQLPVKLVIIGAVMGALVIIIDEFFFKNKKFRLHLMPMAVGIYLPVTLATPILIGGLIRYAVDRVRKVSVSEGDDKGVLLSSGLIAGEAIMGVIVAIFLTLNIEFSQIGISNNFREVLSLGVFSVLAFYLYSIAKKE